MLQEGFCAERDRTHLCVVGPLKIYVLGLHGKNGSKYESLKDLQDEKNESLLMIHLNRILNKGPLVGGAR